MSNRFLRNNGKATTPLLNDSIYDNIDVQRDLTRKQEDNGQNYKTS